MADESNLAAVSPARAVRWGAFALLVLAAVVLYFRDGRRLPAFAAPTPSADSTR
jgi:hypothetical protein